MISEEESCDGIHTVKPDCSPEKNKHLLLEIMGFNLMLLEGESCDGIHTVKPDCSPEKKNIYY